jgi:hypothetical protein
MVLFYVFVIGTVLLVREKLFVMKLNWSVATGRVSIGNASALRFDS